MGDTSDWCPMTEVLEQEVKVDIPREAAARLFNGPCVLTKNVNDENHIRCVKAVKQLTDADPQRGKTLPKNGGYLSDRWGPGKLETAYAEVDNITNQPGGVNDHQAAAFKTALTQTLSIWQGPPGTGKPTLLLHFLHVARGLMIKDKTLVGRSWPLLAAK
ncbi:TPA: hypothetical protein ACH3X3_012199 [Trebouxia sp. C0006]